MDWGPGLWFWGSGCGMIGWYWHRILHCAQVPGVAQVLLPHEVLALMMELGDGRLIFESEGLDPTSQAHLQRGKEVLGGGPLAAISLWGDAVPNTWDRNSSVEVLTWALPGLVTPPWKDMRIIFAALPHDLTTTATLHQLLAVFPWSMQCLFKGLFPSKRHDGEAWNSLDSDRAKKADQNLGLKALLCQVRGDWKAFKEVFGLPGWHPGGGPICWRCRATWDNLVDRGHDSVVFQEDFRLNSMDFLARLALEGKPLCPIWQSPLFSSSVFKLDWLHVMDKGVGVFFMGGLVQYFCRQRFYGSNFEVRAAYLWELIQTFYRREGVKDRLHQLTSNMVKSGLTSLGAAELRALIPFGLELTTRMCGELHSDLRTLHAVHAAMGHLKGAYDCLHVDVERVRGPQGVLFNQAVAFHSLLVTLNEEHPDLWELRPKHHMFLELAYEDSMPSRTWTYREESHGGSVAHQTRRRGGPASTLACSRTALTLFCAREPFPRMRQ